MSVISHTSQDGKELTIKIDGRFDFNSAALFREAYETQEVSPNAYIIDLKDSEYVDSSALGMLLALRDFAGGDKANIQLIHCSSSIKKILQITKLNELFKVE